ncbi:hypothetical protein Tco_0925650 [Tanacetum coccineum]|uniref:CCHC-type domain-containing protein n=1 Tax=Tanacetum coccineum TaxID=301880 RepID=A0ABQ5D7H1_9ASTR
MAPSTSPIPNTSLPTNSDNSINDPLSISNSDHPGMIEKQKQVTHPSFEPIDFFANLNGNKATNNGRREFKNNSSSRTEFKKVCTGCNQEGHLIKQCFKWIGYPDWYKGKKGKKGASMAAQVTLDDHMAGDTPFDMGYENGIGVGKNGMFDQKLVAA